MENNDNEKNLKKKVQELEEKLKKCSSDSLNSQTFIEKNNLYYYAFFIYPMSFFVFFYHVGHT